MLLLLCCNMLVYYVIIFIEIILERFVFVYAEAFFENYYDAGCCRQCYFCCSNFCRS